MGFYYHPVGWGLQTGKVYPEGSTTTALRPVNGSVCSVRLDVDVSQDIADVVQPKYEATKDQRILYTTAMRDQKDEKVASDYFGGMYTPDIVAAPPVSFLPLGSWRLRPKSKRKVFEEQKKAGKIVLHPLDIYAASATIIPGIRSDYVTPPVRVQFLRYQCSEFPPVYSPACKLYGNSFASHPDEVTGGYNVSATKNIWSVLDAYYVPKGLDPWYVASDDEVWDLVYLLRESVENVDWSGLVASTIAEANNKNLDLLTNLGELPETFRFVISVLKTILGLVTNFRKEAAAIKKRYMKSVHLAGNKSQGVGREMMTDLSSLWLQYRYALMPLIYTVEDALGILLKGEVEYRTTRKKARRNIALSSTDWNISDFEVIDRCFVKHRFEYNLENYSSASNFLTTNPALTLWELTTLSFVVDWVFNIGDLLAAFDTPEGVTQEACQISSKVATVVRCTHKTHVGAAVDITLGRYIAKPIQPMLHIGLTTNFSLSWKQSMDAVALLWGGIRKSFGR